MTLPIDELIEKLEPCPFCGGPATLEYTGEWGRFDTAEATCPRCCFSIGQAGQVEGHDQAMASAAACWNTRAPDPALSSLQEQKRKLEDGLQTIHDLCDDEIKARFRSGSSLSEAEAAKNSRVYPLLALPRNIARALLSGAGE